MFSLEKIQYLSETTGYRSGPLEIVMRLGQMLRAVSEDPFLRDRLLLKGGTAINMFLSDPQRLSVDADYDYIGSGDKEIMAKEKVTVTTIVTQIALSQGYTIEKISSAHAGDKFYLKYKSVLGEQSRIQMDICYLNRIPLLSPQKRTMWQPEGEKPIEVQLCSTEAIIAGKCNAIMERVVARDYFDLCHLPSLFDGSWPSPSLKRLFVFFSGVQDHPISSFAIDRLDRLTQADAERTLADLLKKGEEVSAKQLIEGAKESLLPLLDLEDHEKEYVERIQLGEYKPELLFSDEPEFLEVLRGHPALLWKTLNKQRYRAKLKGELPWDA